MSYDQRWHRGLVITGVNINAAGTDAGTFVFPAQVLKWRPTKLTIYEASTSLAASLATVGLFTGAGGTGATLVTAAVLTTLTSATICFDMTLAVANGYQTATTVYLRNVVAHGSSATVSASLSFDWLG